MTNIDKSVGRRIAHDLPGFEYADILGDDWANDLLEPDAVPPHSSRVYALGLGSTLVAGRSSATIRFQPPITFRPERLIVPSNLAVDFLVNNIKVGKRSQLLSTGALPAVIFDESSFGIRLKGNICRPSMFIAVSMTNQNRTARSFQGGIVGAAFER
jgi:hypothetical protein